MKALILSANSDIGEALSISLKNEGYEIFGTYKKNKPGINIPDNNLLKLDIKDYDSDKYRNWLKTIGDWDLFISGVGTQEPVGKFINVDINEWVEGVAINSTYQIAALINAIKEQQKEIDEIKNKLKSS